MLGCGPAGLFAAYAAEQTGAEVQVISKLRRSEMYGAQYLHSEIPGLTDGQKPFEVEYRLEGDLDDYLKKVYGDTIPDRSAITVESLVGKYPAWDIRAAYHRAFDLAYSKVYHHEVRSDSIAKIASEFRPDLLISTIPATSLCLGGHSFDVRKIWAIGDAPERGVWAPRFSNEPGLIQYDGTRFTGWYRYSLIAGYASVEWPYGTKPPIPEVAEVLKPVGTTCDCWLDMRRVKVLRLGRYGAWDRKGHTHQAYWATLAAMKEL